MPVECHFREFDDYSGVPCASNLDDSFCCYPGEGCLSNGFCWNGTMMILGSCTNQDWNTDKCPTVCPNKTATNDVGVAIITCGKNHYCCSPSNNCCDESGPDVYHFDLPPISLSSVVNIDPSGIFELPTTWSFVAPYLNASTTANSGIFDTTNEMDNYYGVAAEARATAVPTVEPKQHRIHSQASDMHASLVACLFAMLGALVVKVL